MWLVAWTTPFCNSRPTATSFSNLESNQLTMTSPLCSRATGRISLITSQLPIRSHRSPPGTFYVFSSPLRLLTKLCIIIIDWFAKCPSLSMYLIRFVCLPCVHTTKFYTSLNPSHVLCLFSCMSLC